MPATATRRTKRSPAQTASEALERLLPPHDGEPILPARDRVALGVLVKPWGRRGEQTVKLYNPASDLLQRVDAVFVEGDALSPRRITFRDARWIGRRYVIHIDGIEAPEQAELLRGLELSVPAAVLPLVDDDDEYYVRDLLGLSVFDGQGEPVGTLADVFSTGSNDVYVVRGPAGERLIPALKTFVRSVDLEGRRMVLEEDALRDIPLTSSSAEH